MTTPTPILGERTFRWTWEVDSRSDGERADKALFLALRDTEEELPQTFSRTQVQALMKEGRVFVNDARLQKAVSLKVGDRVEIWVEPPVPLDLTPINLPLEILYQDEHILFVNKPAGISVHPSETESGPTLVHILLHHIKDLSGIGGTLRPGIVHRLDKFTSGVMVVSKSNEAHQKLVAAFQTHEHERKYWALCYGAPMHWGIHEKRFESKIGRDPTDRKKMSATVKEGKDAISVFQCLEQYRVGKSLPFGSLIEASLHTGRTHQVRVHLNALQHSIFGDSVYGRPAEQQAKWKALPQIVSARVSALEGQALHARLLGVKHPMTGVLLKIEAEPPKDFQDLIDSLRTFR